MGGGRVSGGVARRVGLSRSKEKPALVRRAGFSSTVDCLSICLVSRETMRRPARPRSGRRSETNHEFDSDRGRLFGSPRPRGRKLALGDDGRGCRRRSFAFAFSDCAGTDAQEEHRSKRDVSKFLHFGRPPIDTIDDGKGLADVPLVLESHTCLLRGTAARVKHRKQSATVC